MIIADKPGNEAERLGELGSFSILDSLPEEDYDNLTAIAAELCNTPIALISFVDQNRQWFKSRQGIDVCETPRDISFCSHAILNPNDILVIPDASKDERFCGNPAVSGEPPVIFYAGVPLKSSEGIALGTLCVVDHQPRNLSAGQQKSLKALARQVVNLLELRRNRMRLVRAFADLEERNRDLEQFAFIAAHDIKSPLNNIVCLADLLKADHLDNLNADGKTQVDLISRSAVKLKSLVDGLMTHRRSELALSENISAISTAGLLRDMNALFGAEGRCRIEIITALEEVHTNHPALDQVLVNLVANAQKYNDKPVAEIRIGISKGEHYEFYVEDNGPGIIPEKRESVFNLFEVGAAKDRYGEPGNGIGLATVRKLIRLMGGEIQIESASNGGARFVFTLPRQKQEEPAMIA